MSKSPSTSSTERTPQGGMVRRRLLTLSVVVGVVLLLIAVALIVSLGLRGAFQGEKTPETSAATDIPAPTMSVSPPPTPSCETVIGSGDAQVAMAPPVSLTVSGKVFPVEPIVTRTRAWRYPSDRSGAAVWVCGTVVNYVVGLEPTPENRTLMTDLRPGDTIRLQLTSGVILSFRFAERREASVGEASVLEQRRPRLTLILAREGAAWQVATADYVAEAEPMKLPSPETSIPPGQPAEVGDVQVTVEKGHVRRDDELPPGTMYYLVEFSITNEGSSPVSTDMFSMKLRDGIGNSYLISPAASAAGEQGPLSGEVEPGDTALGTAGYMVPDPLAGPSLTWIFSPRPGSETRVSVSIPYEAEAGGSQPSAGRAEVTVVDAFVDEAGARLIIQGEVRNTGTGKITIQEGDIHLTSNAGVSPLQDTDPQLPVTIPPGESRRIELRYERPEAPTALFELRGYSFEIGGL